MAVNVRWFDPMILALPVLTSPLIAIQIFGMALLYLAWGRAFVYEPTRRIVLRMDLLPNIESVSIMKVGNFGSVYNEIVRVQDLEKVSRESEYEKTNALYHSQKFWIDWDMTFRNKKTGEFYIFEE